MAPTQTKRILLAATAIVVAVAVTFAALRFFRETPGRPRQDLVFSVPADATSVIFVDVEQLRASPFLTTLYSWVPHAAEDAEYTKFIADTGFNYERDLSRILVAF